jgi:hypothetical protein
MRQVQTLRGTKIREFVQYTTRQNPANFLTESNRFVVQLITVETTLRLYWQDTRLKVTKKT